MKKTKLHLNYAGYCWAKEKDAIKGGRNIKIKFHALWGIIKHPDLGYFLYDTGYSKEFFEATSSFPNKIYALTTKVELSPNEEAICICRNYGLNPADISGIIITHFHADHIGGLKSFPNATIYASKKALNYTLGLSNAFAFSKGVLKLHIPDDIKERVEFIEDKPILEDDIFGLKYDLFEDESIFIYELPGHARGQIGVYLETEKKPYFLIADAVWLSETYKSKTLPNPIVKLFFDSWSDYKKTVYKLNSFHKNNQNVEIVPTHCSETTKSLISKDIDFEKL